MKRKVAELPPVKEADFNNRMVKHEEQRKVLNGETKVRNFTKLFNKTVSHKNNFRLF